jgi:SAM-dependent methyltransferase
MFEALKKKISGFYGCSLHRQLLNEAIRGSSCLAQGLVLDVGSRNRRYDSFLTGARKIIAVDLKPESGKDVIAADARALPFGREVFDAVVSFEVFEYVLDMPRVIKEVARVLKPGGVFIFSVPFLDPVHGDVDNVRYTEKSWRIFLDAYFNIRECILLGGRHTVIWDFFFEKVRNSYGRWGKLSMLPFLYCTKLLALGLDRRGRNARFPMGYVFVCDARLREGL